MDGRNIAPPRNVHWRRGEECWWQRLSPPPALDSMLSGARLLQTVARGCIPTPLPDGNKIAPLRVDRPLRKSILNIGLGGDGGAA